MPPFRFHIPFFSSNSPSRLSSGTSSPSPPPIPPPPSRPAFRPAGIAQPSSKPEPKPKMSPSLSRARSNVAALAASFSASQSPSRGTPTPRRLAKQMNQQSGSSPSKKLDSLKTEEQKLTTKEKPSRETERVAGEKINTSIEKPPTSHLKGKEAEVIQEQGKKTEAEKLAVQESKKLLHEGSGKKSAADQGQEKKKEIEKLAVQERKQVLHEGTEEKSEADQGQQKRKDKEKLALEETNKAPQGVVEDATRSKTTRHISAALESTRGPRDVPENRREMRTNDNHQKTKGASSTSNLENPRVTNGQGSSSMSRRIKEDIKDGISKLTLGKHNGDDQKSVSVYTLTGENKGATMGIASDKNKKDGEVHIRRGYRSNPDESPNTTTTTETEGGRIPFNGQNPKDEDEEEEEETSVRAYINGNTQGINNSIVVESSVSENDPGVHMSLKFEISRKKTVHPPENVEQEKKPKKVTVTEMSKNEPRIRRRCLRGLLAESSESDPENSIKPRRHGCRFTYKDKDIENT